jgi:YD repeat-containing protein
MANKPYMTDLKAANMVGIPLNIQTSNKGTNLSERLTVYEKNTSTSNLVLPKAIYAAKFPNTFPIVFMDKNLEKKVTYDQYDDKGNILQYTLENDTPVSIIWGYNKTQPIAKIENATYNQIMSYVANLQNLSNTGTEANLILSLNALRTSFPNAMVTTYTYVPLVGISTITDPKGDKITYTYDPLGRLQFAKDAQGNLLSESQYHYKNQ